MSALNRANVQAIIPERYRTPLSRHLLFAFDDAADGARAFLARIVPMVTMADHDLAGAAGPLVNLSLTWKGMTVLDPFGPDAAVEAEKAFMWDFREAADDGSLRLGGDSATPHWWNRKFLGSDICMIVHLHCTSEAVLTDATAAIRASAARHQVRELVPTVDGEAITGRAFAGRQLHFGYQDGITTPPVNWDDLPDSPKLLPRGLFMIDDWIEDAQSFPRHPPFRDFARDGAYVAFVWMHQRVAAFRTYLRDTAPALWPDRSPAEAEELLAAKMMGRWRSGAPLQRAPDRDNPALAEENDFGYAADMDGARCPFAAHIRVVNARDQPLNYANRSMFPRGFPQVLRRGAPYGPDLDGFDDDGVDRGTVGMFVCANLNKQFYPLTRWIGKTDFSDVYTDVRGQDPVIGVRAFPGASTDFEIPVAGAPSIVLKSLPQFVRVQGVALAFIPSGRALRALAHMD